MGSSGDVTARRLVGRHGRRQQRVQALNKRLRAETEHMRGACRECHKEHLEQLQNAEKAIRSTGVELQGILDAQARDVKGYKEARERLKRGLLSRLWFALGLAWRGSFL